MPMRSLADTGLNTLPPFIRPTELDARPFEMLSATLNPNGYEGRPEVVLTIRDIEHDEGRLAPARYDDDGEPLGPIYALTLSPTPSRERFVEHFRANPRDTLGPLQFQFIPSRQKGGSPFANIVDYVEFEALPAPRVGPRAPIADENACPVSRGVAAHRPDGTPRNGRRAASRAESEPPVRPDDDDDMGELPF